MREWHFRHGVVSMAAALVVQQISVVVADGHWLWRLASVLAVVWLVWLGWVAYTAIRLADPPPKR